MEDAQNPTVAWYDPSTHMVHTRKDDGPIGAQVWPLTAEELAKMLDGKPMPPESSFSVYRTKD